MKTSALVASGNLIVFTIASDGMSNRLQFSSSPYLLQHKDNPVDWFPWGDEALQKAARENKPIFLSVGYSSCHWCHVMEREAFSDEGIAQVLNEKFVPIKVDREERPDIDQLYMQAVQIMTGSGGWPLNVFLTPDLRPFYGGTYFPMDARYGRPPFKDILHHLDEAYKNRLEDVRRSADQLTGMIVQNSLMSERRDQLSKEFWDKCVSSLRGNFDSKNGGLGGAPKFFYVDGHRNLLRHGQNQKNEDSLDKVCVTLEKISHGGIYDQVGGGFHRYSTDAAWRIPHFEKMLYDNALLLRLFAETHQIKANQLYADVMTETVEWLSREMKSPEGGFYSAIDADSDHEEGLFYVWTFDELKTHVSSEEFSLLEENFDFNPDGTFEGRIHFIWKTLPSHDTRQRVKSIFSNLLNVRAKRVWPLIDKKILTSWNGLLISGLAFAGRALKQEKWIKLAEETSDFLWKSVREQKNLWHSQFEGKVSKVSFLEDFAYLAESLFDLWEITQKRVYLDRACELANDLMTQFYDSENGGFWTTLNGQKDLLTRSKDFHDGAIPSAYQVACSVMSRAFAATGENRYLDAYNNSTQAVFGTMEQSPGAFNRLALVLKDHDTRVATLGACTPDGVCAPLASKVCS